MIMSHQLRIPDRRSACDRVGRPLIAVLLIAALTGATSPAAGEAADPHALLLELAERFSWVPIESQATTVQIELTGDPGGSWYLQPLDGGDVVLHPGTAPDPGFSCELDRETLQKLYEGELSGVTAAGKDDAGAPSPLEILPGSAVPERAEREALAPVFHFLSHFWNRTSPERIPVGRDHARSLHGAQMVGLYYHPGFRSAWYSIRGDEVLNGEGDTTAYPQAFVIVSGRARVRYGQRWIDVEAGETIYVPPGTLHAIRSRDGGEVTIVWMAWGEGA
jgi:mannose-6-phosphate isomerase-like protein (cupin superfamily)